MDQRVRGSLAKRQIQTRLYQFQPDVLRRILVSQITALTSVCCLLELLCFTRPNLQLLNQSEIN